MNTVWRLNWGVAASATTFTAFNRYIVHIAPMKKAALSGVENTLIKYQGLLFDSRLYLVRAQPAHVGAWTFEIRGMAD